MTVQKIISPSGETLIVLAEDDYEDLCDSLELAKSKAAFACGEEERLTEAEVRRALDAATPLAFWREKRGLTQKALGAAVGIGQSYVAALERGDRRGDPALFKRLAAALRVRMEDLVAG